MNTAIASLMCIMSQGNELMVFDWEKAAQLIAERGARAASAGLSGDWEWTGGIIFANGSPVPQEDTYVFLASKWAVPEIDIDGDLMDCYRLESDCPGWNAETYWPKEALGILRKKTIEGGARELPSTTSVSRESN